MKKSQAINLGLTYSVVSIILFLIQVIVAGGTMFSVVMGIVTFAVVVALCIIFIRRERAEKGGLISFKEAFTTAFVGLLIGGIVSVLFTLIYVTYVDATYIDKMVYTTLESTKGFMEGNMGDEQVNEVLLEMETDMRAGFTPLGMAKSMGYFAIFYLVVSLILAASLKKVNPLATPYQTETLDR